MLVNASKKKKKKKGVRPGENAFHFIHSTAGRKNGGMGNKSHSDHYSNISLERNTNTRL